MASPQWNDTEEIAPSWDDTEDVLSPDVSKIESFGRGLAQGGSFGLADEATGAFKSPTGALKEIANKFGTDFSDEDIEAYKKERDDSRKNYKLAEDANPLSYGAGQIGGGLATAVIPGAGASTLGQLAGRGAMEGAAYGLGTSEAEGASDLGVDALKGAGLGAAGGAVAKGVMMGGEAIGRAAPSIRSFAEKAAVNATGATGKESAKFADDAGRQLLDRGIVGFGDSQAGIAKKAAAGVDIANREIDSALKSLEASGVKVDGEKIHQIVSEKIDQLASDPSQADIARQLKGELDNLVNAVDARGGQTDFNITDAEKIKRGYNRKAGNWMDPEKGQVGKEMYQTWRGAVEDAATNVDPDIAKSFVKGKESYGLLRPIEEAAERRAATTAQSPPGGFLDVTAGALGAAAGGPGGGVIAPIARRIVSPRISSSVAVGADKLSKVLTQNAAAFGKYAGALGQAASRGGNSLAASHYVLQNTDPEYRKTINGIFDDGNQD